MDVGVLCYTPSMQDLPQYDFGTTHSYASWTPGTMLQLGCVPWDATYRDIVYFATDDALAAYVQKTAAYNYQIPNNTVVFPNRPIKLDVPISLAQQFNYIRVVNPVSSVLTNPTQNDFTEPSGTVYYYFIRDIQYIAPNTTQLSVQLDVWQTYGRKVQFANSYIERGHVGIANENSFDNFGQDYLTTPEGFDIGNEYTVSQVYTKTLGDLNNWVSASNNAPPVVAVWATTDLLSWYGDVDNPSLKTAQPSTFEGLPNAQCLIIFNSVDDFETYMKAAAATPWVTQGISSVQLLPDINSGTYHGLTFTPHSVSIRQTDGSSQVVTFQTVQGRAMPQLVQLGPNWRSEMLKTLPSRYQKLTKFATFPYSNVELTTYSGSPLVLKPECMPAWWINVVQLTHLAQPSPRIMFYPQHYNNLTLSAQDIIVGGNEYPFEDHGEFLDLATGITDFPTFTIVNNSYISYMAANRHSINFQFQNAEWSQQKALTGNQLSFNQAGANMNLMSQMQNIQLAQSTQSTNLANQTAGYRAIQSGINSGVGGMEGILNGQLGSAIGAGMGIANAAAGYAIDTNQNNQSLAINNAALQARTSASLGNAGYMRDTNKAYADWAAQGDYANSIAAINAKLQDCRLMQPSTAGQTGGDAMNLVAYKWVVQAKVKRLQTNAIAIIGEYWLRYGYAINRFGRMPSNYQVMDKFTYWKLRESYITNTLIPEEFKLAIKGIFEKGVTVWNNADDIGNIDLATNNPLPGVTL